MLPSRHRPSAADTDGFILTATQANILEALHPPGTERLAKQFAARAGYRNNSRFRTVLREMLLSGLLQRGANGYRLFTLV